MMKSWKGLWLLFLCVLGLSFVSQMDAEAGTRRLASSFLTETGELNSTEWNSSDANIILKDGKLLIPAETSTIDTKFVMKNIATANSMVDEIVSADATFRITQLPKGQKLIFALGLNNIEGASEDTGNVEIAFVNNGGLYVTVTAYGEEGAVTLVQNKKCNFSLNSQIRFEATISGDSVLNVKLNNSAICNRKIPVTGEGRFGIIQTGLCGAEIFKLNVTCNYYETPENVNIEEDFESGEINANTLVSQLLYSNGLTPSTMKIEEYNGSNVLMFRNVGHSYFGTMYQYSNFEISFDVPYFLREDLYNEDGDLIAKYCDGFGIGFGEEVVAPTLPGTFVTDTDLIIFGRTHVFGYLNSDYLIPFEELDLYSDTNGGFSVKFIFIDGHSELQMKSLASKTWKTVATWDYDSFRSGYINIWTTGQAYFALDNIKIINRDKNPNLIEPEYKSSVLTAEDYVLTEEDTKLVFREDAEGADASQSSQFNEVTVVWIAVGVALVVILVGIVLLNAILQRQKRRKGGQENESV